MPQLNMYRHIVDVLLAEHEASTPPTVNDGYPIHLLSCTWGIYTQIYRFGRSAVILMDSGMGQEAIVLVRAMLEYTVLLHWIVERGDDGVEALLANQEKRIKAWFKHAEGTSLVVPPELVTELTSEYPQIDEGKAVRAFEKVCKEIGARDLYAVYGFHSLFVHPTITTSNVYCTTSGNDTALSLEPGGDGHAANISLIAHCLIWAGRDFDQLTPGNPRAEGLERLAHQVMARPILPAYRPVTQQTQRPGRRGRRRGRGRARR
ncbi:MAG: DUF5677 domain-containing protein [Streptosporangiaceae bacterium]